MNSEEIKATIERLRSQYDKGFGYSLDDVACAFLGESYGMGVALSSKFRDALIVLLEQADPDTHVELPRDVDEVPIHVGDEVDLFYTNTDDQTTRTTQVTVGSLSYDRNGWGLHTCDQPYHIDPKNVRHRKPTVEEVLKHVISGVVKYADKNRDKEVVDAYIDEVASVYGEHLRKLMETPE